MPFVSSRGDLTERYQKQADGSPSPFSAKDCERGNDDEASVMTFGELKALVEELFQGFFYRCRDDQDVDLAVWATELLQYLNGPAPEIEILPQGDGRPSLFRVTIDPQ